MPPRKNKLPVPLPEGWIVTDTSKKSWKLGKKLGQGGFGLIYLASPACDTPVYDSAAYVIKVENHQNGPLFCELKFYQRAAKQDDVTKWIQSHKLDYLGIPRYWGSGETTFNSISYRFMVIDRLGSDLHDLQKSNSLRLPLQAVMQVGVRMLDVLEYIHEHEYVHGDIKAGNILCHLTDPSKVYLADYGLSYRYCPDGKHKEYKEDPRKCHNGTLEFTSLDAHKGAAPSRRGDLEILSFCMLHWLSGRLPWDQDLKSPSTVQTAKQKLMDQVPNSVTAWLGQEDGCNDIAKFMAEVRNLQYSAKPNYKVLKEILLKALESAGTRLCAPLIFCNQNSTSTRPTAPKIKIEPHQNKANGKEAHNMLPKKVNAPKPHPIQKMPKQVKNTNAIDLVNGDDDYYYGKCSRVQRTNPFDLQDERVDIHESKVADNIHSTQKYKPSVSNRRCQKDKTYWEERKDPCSQYQERKDREYLEERDVLIVDPNSQYQNWRGKSNLEERVAPVQDQKSLHQEWKDILRYGLTIPVLLVMIYCAIYGLK